MEYFYRFPIQFPLHIGRAKALKTQPETRDPSAYDANPIIQDENAVIEGIMEIILHAGLSSHQAKALLKRTITLLEWGKEQRLKARLNSRLISRIFYLVYWIMCGRFTRKENLQHLTELVGLKVLPAFSPRYNIAPSQLIPCVRTNPATQERECIALKWGLVPSWAKDPSIGNKLINARGETVAEKPAFRKAFKQQRCLVLADGFYEWKREEKTKQPYYIRFKDQRLFAFAGLWERWEKQEPALETCALITTGPNALMEPIHNRMPVILPEQSYASWLNPSLNNTIYLSGLLEPYQAEEMEAFPVSSLVNNPRNGDSSCIHSLD